MSGKMKFTLAFLALLTPFSLSYLFSALTYRDRTPLNASVLEQFDTFSLLDDADGDGLSNREENLWHTNWRVPDTDGDGFKDGEEVLSGHDPLKRGPNDFLDPTKNLTQQYTSLFVGGILSGDIAPGNAANSYLIGTITDEVFDEYEKFALSKKNFTLTVVKDDAESFEKYLTTMEPHLRKTFPDSIRATEEFLRLYGTSTASQIEDLLADEDTYLRMLNNATKARIEMDELSQSLMDIPTPTSMERPHANGIVLLQQIANQLEVSMDITDDPVKTLLANTALAQLVSRTSIGFAYDYGIALESLFKRLIARTNLENEKLQEESDTNQ